MAVSAIGIGSGLDLNNLVNQLIAAQRDPANQRINTREAGLQTRISGLGTLKSGLEEFRTTLSGLRASSAFTANQAESSDTSAFTASAQAGALPASYSVDVTQLAQSQKLASAAYSDTGDVVGEGTLTIRFGTFDSGANTFTADPDRDIGTITIDSTNNTLAGIRDAINDANVGVSASVVDDGTGNRLVLGANQTGTASSMQITVTGDSGGTDVDSTGLSALAFDPTASAGAGKNLTQTAAALDAALTIDGLNVTRSDNTVTGAIEGVTLTLKDTSDTPGTLSVSRDTSAVTSAVQSFVDAYNSLVDTFESLGGFDEETETGGILIGDAVLRSIESSVRRVSTNLVAGLGNTDFRALADIGVTTVEGGRLALDSAVLDAAFASSPDGIAGLLAVSGFATDSAVGFVSATSDAPVGEFTVEVTQLATRGSYVGAAASSLVIDANNSTLAINLDGVQSGTITLSEGTYASETELAAELQARINADSALSAENARIAVSFSGGVYTLTSDRFGSASQVQITSAGSASAATLGIGSAVGTATGGQDVAGLIGNTVATGDGRQLTGAGVAAGLAVEVSGGSVGQRGTVTFSRGVADQLHDIVETFLADDAVLEASLDGLDAQVAALDGERESLARRLEANEARLRSQFTALDVLVSQLQTTSTFLTQQLAAIPQINVNNN
ncbi:MAG: flagellar filament capping protein FliD [Pseudomonadota bacterium]